ncbi:hypothetical protein MRX96_048942 [Rhipicephalus microplus]
MLLNIMPTKGDHSFNGDEYESKSNAVKSGQAPISLGHEQCQKVPVPPLSCPICNKAFGRKYHLARHLRNAVCSTEHKLSLPCPTCGKLFSSKAKLDYHVTTHEVAANNCKQSPLKRFECHQCGRLLWSQPQLKIHQRTHTGERPFACPECSKTFVSLGALNKHKLSHSKEKPFVCPPLPCPVFLEGHAQQAHSHTYWHTLSQVSSLLQGFHPDSLADKLRENCKILFTKVLEDDVAGKLLDDDQSVDAVLDKVLELARLG